jgi:hypothetical protein
VKTTGDGFLATFDATGRALHCAADILAGPGTSGWNCGPVFIPVRSRSAALTSLAWR